MTGRACFAGAPGEPEDWLSSALRCAFSSRLSLDGTISSAGVTDDEKETRDVARLFARELLCLC